MGIPLSGQANLPRHLSRILTPQRQRWLLATLVATITFGSGLLNLFSVMGGPRHPKILGDFFPLEFIRLSRTFTLLIGFALVTSSLNIFARKRRAWMIVLGLSSFSIVFHLTRGPDYWEATLSLVLVIVLLLTRKTFSVKSSAPDLRWGLVRLAIAVGLVLLYGVAGFWLLDERHFGINFHIGDSIRSALRVLSFTGDARLVPRTSYGRWFLDSLYITAGTGMVYAGFAIFRPVIYRFGTRLASGRLPVVSRISLAAPRWITSSSGLTSPTSSRLRTDASSLMAWAVTAQWCWATLWVRSPKSDWQSLRSSNSAETMDGV